MIWKVIFRTTDSLFPLFICTL